MDGSMLTVISNLAEEMRAIRNDIHRHPELGFNERRTSAVIAGER
jgi:hippurate hydrolase